MSESEERPLEKEVARHLDKQSYIRRTWMYAGVLMVALVAISVLSTLLWVNSRGQVEQLAPALDKSRAQVEYCARKDVPKTDPRCQAPVAPPASEITKSAPVVIPKVGPTEEEIRKMVEAEVAAKDLKLTSSQMNTLVQSAATVAATKIPKPKDGKTPTAAELAPLVKNAVTAFCAKDACKGDSIKGDKGDPPSRETLEAILAAFCEDRNNCVGSDGKNGTDGEAGPPGRGIKSITSTQVPAGVTVTITLTDDTQIEFTVPRGPKGEDGDPTKCPEGFSSQKVVVTEDGTPPTQKTILTCVLIDG